MVSARFESQHSLGARSEPEQSRVRHDLDQHQAVFDVTGGPTWLGFVR